MEDRIHVAVGVIYNKDKDKVLISKRTDKQHLSGLWEFPGGKVEKGEDVGNALKRELFEELGIVVKQTKRLKTISHDYPDKKVLLDIWFIDDWQGKVIGRENQEVIWAPVNDLNKYTFPEANKQIIKSISLPSIYLISQTQYNDTSALVSVLEKCFSAGLRIFQLRLESKWDELSNIVNELKQLSNFYNAKLILNGSPNDINQYNIDGVHLNSKELLLHSKRPIDEKYILGASCHNEKEVLQANILNVDYIFISPIFNTKSHPDSKPIGWDNFNYLCEKTNSLVYALGGMFPKDKEIAKSYGAHGIAMLSAIWDADDPGKIIQTC